MARPFEQIARDAISKYVKTCNVWMITLIPSLLQDVVHCRVQ